MKTRRSWALLERSGAYRYINDLQKGTEEC